MWFFSTDVACMFMENVIFSWLISPIQLICDIICPRLSRIIYPAVFPVTGPLIVTVYTPTAPIAVAVSEHRDRFPETFLLLLSIHILGEDIKIRGLSLWRHPRSIFVVTNVAERCLNYPNMVDIGRKLYFTFIECSEC